MWAHGLQSLVVSLALVLVGAAYAPASTPRYRLTVLPTLGGIGYSHAFAINNQGKVVGESPDVRNCAQAVVWFGGQVRPLGTLNATAAPCEVNSVVPSYSSANGVNDSGVAAGASMKSDGEVAAATFSAGTVRDAGFNGWFNDINNSGVAVGVGPDSNAMVSFGSFNRRVDELPGWSEARPHHAEAINDRGQIVGLAMLPAGDAAAYLYSSPGSVELLRFANQVEPFDINNGGTVVGGHSRPNDKGGTAFMYTAGSVLDLGTLPNTFYPYPSSVARAVNDRGWAVGESFTCPVGTSDKRNCQNSAVLFRDGRIYDLNKTLSAPSDLHLVSAFDVNERGQIVGYGGDDTADDYHFAFLLTPVD